MFVVDRQKTHLALVGYSIPSCLVPTVVGPHQLGGWWYTLYVYLSSNIPRNKPIRLVEVYIAGFLPTIRTIVDGFLYKIMIHPGSEK